jgi:hypothetical protein
MNTDDLIKTAKYLDELGSYKTADQFENKLVKLAQGGKLIVDPAIKKEITFLEQQIKKLTITEPYYLNDFYSEAPYIKNELVKISPGELEKRLAKIKSTQFIKDFNLKRADFLSKKAQQYFNDSDITSSNIASSRAKTLRDNANSGAISPFESSKPTGAKPGKPGKPGVGSSGATGLGKASVKVKPTGTKPGTQSTGKPGLGFSGSGPTGGSPSGTDGAGGGTSGGGASGGGASGAVPAAKLGTVAELDTLIADLENITANQKIWSENSNSIIPKIRNANRLFTSLYETLDPRQARFFGNRLDMISIANTTYVGKTGTGMR